MNNNDNLNFSSNYYCSSISLLVQNVDGLVTKWHDFINSNLFNLHQIMIFQETNFKESKHMFDSLGHNDFTFLNLSYFNSKTWCRGMAICYSNQLNIPKPKILSFESCSKFEIKGLAFKFLTFQLLMGEVTKADQTP